VGDWGTGNFESDTAADHLSILTDRFITEVADAMAGDPVGIEPDEFWGVAVPANLELLSLRARQYVWASLPEAEVVEGWKKTYMAVSGLHRQVGGLIGLQGRARRSPDPYFRRAGRALTAAVENSP
jgi:hypothetical protein